MLQIEFKSIPDKPYLTELGNTRHKARLEEQRSKLNDPDHVYSVNGVLYWKSNNAVVPMSVFREYYAVAPAAQRAAYDGYLDESIALYKKQREDFRENSPELWAEAQAEQQAMARAAMGPGVEMVNVLTGERYTT